MTDNLLYDYVAALIAVLSMIGAFLTARNDKKKDFGDEGVYVIFFTLTLLELSFIGSYATIKKGVSPELLVSLFIITSSFVSIIAGKVFALYDLNNYGHTLKSVDTVRVYNIAFITAIIVSGFCLVIVLSLLFNVLIVNSK